MNSSITIPLAIVLGGIILAVAVYASIRETAPQKFIGDPSLVRPVSAGDHIFGNPLAPIVIIEYSDFDCPFCKDFHNTLHQIIANEGVNGEVAWVFRHFPITQRHPNALSHARASECIARVAGNEAFWKFAGALFKAQPVDPSRYGELASSIGITGDEFANCYANIPAEIDAKITDDRKNGIEIGVQGTPHSLVLVAGRPPIVMSGAYTYDAVRQLLEQTKLSIGGID